MFVGVVNVMNCRPSRTRCSRREILAAFLLLLLLLHTLTGILTPDDLGDPRAERSSLLQPVEPLDMLGRF